MNPVRGIETSTGTSKKQAPNNFQINESRSRDWNMLKCPKAQDAATFQINESRSRDWNNARNQLLEQKTQAFQINESRSRDWNLTRHDCASYTPGLSN